MAETPLSRTIEEFEHARGDGTDGVWAHGVAWRLMCRDVDPDQVTEGLQEALQVVRETHASPDELFGTSDEHADALHDQWVDEGRLHLSGSWSMSWREVPSWGLGMGAFYSVVFMVFFLGDGDTSRSWTVGMVVIPVGIGVMKAVAWAVWDMLLRSRGPLVAVGGVTATVVVSAAVVGGVNEWGRARPFGEASTWSYLWLAGVCSLLAVAWSRWLESRPEGATPGIADVDDWSRQLAAILRGSYSLSEARVRSIVGDAHAHAADTGRTVQEEFGTPQEYAAGFAPDRARKRRREAWVWVFVGALQGVWLLDDVSWVRAAVTLGCLWVAWQTYHRGD